MDILISICIPSYNRPETLLRLLNSIDINKENREIVEIVIVEDKSPLQIDIRNTVQEFQKKSDLIISYYENEINLGFDKNIREVVSKAKGKFSMFMGDDDIFVPKKLDGFINFIQKYDDYGFFLKSSQHVYSDGKIEKFKYFETDVFQEPSESSYINFFRKSSYLAGLTINTQYSKEFFTDRFDGSLLCEVYLCAEMAINYKSAYYDKIITERQNDAIPFFGSSESEKDLYESGVVTMENSINFLKWYFELTKYIDSKYGYTSTKKILIDMSKYSYPTLATHRDKGLKIFFQYVKQLNKIGYNATAYYYIYVIALILFGKNTCDKIIIFLKNKLGKTPKL